MSLPPVASLTIAEIRAALKAGHYSAVELAQAALLHAESENPETNAFLQFSRTGHRRCPPCR